MKNKIKSLLGKLRDIASTFARGLYLKLNPPPPILSKQAIAIIEKIEKEGVMVTAGPTGSAEMTLNENVTIRSAWTHGLAKPGRLDDAPYIEVWLYGKIKACVFTGHDKKELAKVLDLAMMDAIRIAMED